MSLLQAAPFIYTCGFFATLWLVMPRQKANYPPVTRADVYVALFTSILNPLFFLLNTIAGIEEVLRQWWYRQKHKPLFRNK